ncbi:recombinase family protein [Lactococcus lactis]|uniref:recombinase family protein n=1 Tax=Lactococcus lactis TaxID=1358 RepID=UPI00288F69AF|nr:recombinase family protein [Lactococcus lactis]MDT2909119.1 recombinase family protein [Lactococcus lactis]MDT2925044.1 recombinase family protein [Lactococcus lactis]MDT2951888.1 recombinase family protein [Lactococcus lactis]
MRYAYIRVSTDKQTTENQRTLIESRGFKIDEWLVDEATHGTDDWKIRSIEKAVTESKEGDEIVVAELSRLGRSLSNVLELVEKCRKKEVVIICIREGIELRDDNPITKLLISILGSLAEMERNLIAQRTKDALARKKAEGIILGRPKGGAEIESLKLFKQKDKILKMRAAGVSYSAIGRKLHVHRITVAKFVRKLEQGINHD